MAPARLPIDPTHYARLGLTENASAVQIEAAWRAIGPTLAGAAGSQPSPSLLLPGVADTPALQAQALRLAHAVLSDPDRRAVYDQWLVEERTAIAQARRGRLWWRRRRVWLLAGMGLLLLALLLAGQSAAEV